MRYILYSIVISTPKKIGLIALLSKCDSPKIKGEEGGVLVFQQRRDPLGKS